MLNNSTLDSTDFNKELPIGNLHFNNELVSFHYINKKLCFLF